MYFLSKRSQQFVAATSVSFIVAACSQQEQIAPETAAADDYMAPALRADVEALKQAVASEPTDASTIVQRAGLVADWADAYALAGGEVGLEGPRIRLQSTLPPSGNAAINQSRAVDRLVREFVLREETGALGVLRSENLGPFEARSFATIRQTWRAGTRPIQTGGGFWVARHFSANFGEFQTTDPTGAGYIIIQTTDTDVEFEVETIAASGPHGGFRAPQPAIAFRVAGGQLDRGESVTITYGDTSGGGPGLQIPSTESVRMPLPLYIDLDGSSEWRPLPITPFEIVGTAVAGVHGFAPSVLEPGEPFELSVRAEDSYFNRATGEIPAFNVLVNDELMATTPAGTDPITLIEMNLPQPGVYWISLQSEDGSIIGDANPILVEQDPQFRIFWGDTHGHSGYAEGIGTVDFFMRFARDDARLDFVTHSEHDIWLDAGEWELMRATTAEFDEPGKFTPFLGWEWTRHTRFGGHHNVLFREVKDQIPVSGLSFPVLSELYAELHERYESADVLVIPHAHNPGDYRQSDPQLEPLIEIMSMHGSFQWFMEAYLSHGHEVGVVAASDDHLSHPGYSAPNRNSLAQRGGLGAVFAPEHSRDAIFDGMKEKRTYATTGDRIILNLDVNGTGMGQRAAFSDSRNITGRAIGTAPIRSITLYKNDEQIWQQEYLLDVEADEEQELLLSFQSDPTPVNTGDAPRGWRHWRGTLTVEGAQLESIKAMDFVNPTTQSLQRNGNTVSFRTHTRGDTSSLLMELSEVGPDASIRLEFEEALESGSAPPFYRSHVSVPATGVALNLSELQGGALVTSLPAQDYPSDGLTLRRVVRDGSRDITFSLNDSDDADQGDYYYVKVEQANDAIAWSSPIWVGGYPSR
ncbi:MAG: DUF3604 domain-containing protein [Gammaproteobacteria bacterium]|jgi:hypothetical protein|nr:DUF3604 domain-containing protein [Gammaproteobacteria bacterium]